MVRAAVNAETHANGNALLDDEIDAPTDIFPQRMYTHVTLMGHAVMLGLTWPFSLFTGALALSNGGLGGAVWVFLGVCLGMSTVVLSMAEMASLYVLLSPLKFTREIGETVVS
ncbi:hypothetical protein VTO42DRAFT_6901 [Malbranchea cinnamomea]